VGNANPDAPFNARDRAFLQTLGELAAIASPTHGCARASVRSDPRRAERIAREMHDSLAQVLGVLHFVSERSDERRAPAHRALAA
jgi:nitrate/nitrite-specific signal transduction histidine kinase